MTNDGGGYLINSHNATGSTPWESKHIGVILLFTFLQEHKNQRQSLNLNLS
jgi:hypothetical protein